MSTATLYSSTITFAVYDEMGRQVNLKELVESVVATAQTMTINEKIQFELIARGFNMDPETGKFQSWTDRWLVNQLRDRLPREEFYTWADKPEGAEHPYLRVFTIKRNIQAEDLSYLES